MSAPMVQSVIFPKEKFSISQARKWLKDHHYGGKKVDTTENFYRFRQMKPMKGGRYTTMTLPNGVEIILHYYK